MKFPRAPAGTFIVLAAVGWIGTAIGFWLDTRHTFFSYLAAYVWLMALAFGALAFLAMVHAMNATWPVVVRRLAEGIAASLPLFALLFVPIFVGIGSLYPWQTPEQFGDPHLRELVIHRRAYYNVPFYVVRWVVIFATWTVFAWLFWKWSVRQEKEPGEALHMRLCHAGTAALIPLGLTATVAAHDWLMSLTPTWYSTIYGFYFMAGSVLGGVALTTLIAVFVQGRGGFPVLRPSHLHALGRVLLAFVSFWGYIAFFQFMLIWIANRPAEGAWFVHREMGAWRSFSRGFVAGHFVVPFVCLLSFRLKRSGPLMALLAVWILVFRYIDAYWLVMPAYLPGILPWSWIDAATLLALGGTTGAFGIWLLHRHPLVPAGDPALARALEYESR